MARFENKEGEGEGSGPGLGSSKADQPMVSVGSLAVDLLPFNVGQVQQQEMSKKGPGKTRVLTQSKDLTRGKMAKPTDKKETVLSKRIQREFDTKAGTAASCKKSRGAENIDITVEARSRPCQSQ